MKKINITITFPQTISLVEKTYEFIASQFKMTDDDIKLVCVTLAALIEKNPALKD